MPMHFVKFLACIDAVGVAMLEKCETYKIQISMHQKRISIYYLASVMLGLKDFEIQTIVKNVKSRVKKLP
jgi:hypothetical protein